jgi:hypothetical protein
MQMTRRNEDHFVADLVPQSLKAMGKRDLVRRNSQETSAHRRIGLLVDLATAIATWASSTALSTIITALQTQPSENPVLRKWQKVSSILVKVELRLIVRRRLLSL